MKYSVIFSYSGFKEICVDAVNIDEAIDKAYDQLDKEVDCTIAGLPETDWDVEDVKAIKGDE